MRNTYFDTMISLRRKEREKIFLFNYLIWFNKLQGKVDMCVHIYMYICVCVCVCVYPHTHTCVCVCLHVYKSSCEERKIFRQKIMAFGINYNWLRWEIQLARVANYNRSNLTIYFWVSYLSYCA